MNFDNLISKINSGDFSNRFYSVNEWENIISPFKDSSFRDRIEFGSAIHGYVFNEILPMISVAKSILPKTPRIKFLGPSQEKKDGILEYDDKSTQGLQCVSAINGYEESIRCEKVKKHHHAEAYGKIEYSGTKRKREIPNKLNIVAYRKEDPEIKKKFSNLIKDAIDKKNEKKYKGLWLVIAINGSIPYCFSDEKDKRIVQRLFEEVINNQRDSLSKIYKKAFLFGCSTEIVLQLDL